LKKIELNRIAFWITQIIILVLIGVLFYFNYVNKYTWTLQMDINDALIEEAQVSKEVKRKI
jgi:hypothetical protein